MSATRDEDSRLTRDAAERVRRMLDQVRDPVTVDLDYVKSWIEQR